MENILKTYLKLCNTPSDINEHLPTLYKYAKKCNHVTEMGVRNVVSTYALALGGPKKLICYDIVNCDVSLLEESVKHFIDFKFVKANTLKITIEPTELLFIDTLHNYNQLSAELKLHAGKVSKYIIFHDTTSYEKYGESYQPIREPVIGIWPAIEEFLIANPEWVIAERFTNNNGLTILKKSIKKSSNDN